MGTCYFPIGATARPIWWFHKRTVIWTFSGQSQRSPTHSAATGCGPPLDPSGCFPGGGPTRTEEETAALFCVFPSAQDPTASVPLPPPTPPKKGYFFQFFYKNTIFTCNHWSRRIWQSSRIGDGREGREAERRRGGEAEEGGRQREGGSEPCAGSSPTSTTMSRGRGDTYWRCFLMAWGGWSTGATTPRALPSTPILLRRKPRALTLGWTKTGQRGDRRTIRRRLSRSARPGRSSLSWDWSTQVSGRDLRNLAPQRRLQTLGEKDLYLFNFWFSSSRGGFVQINLIVDSETHVHVCLLSSGFHGPLWMFLS